MSSLHREAALGRRPITSAQDALAVVLHEADLTRPGVICLLLDEGHRGLACLDVGGDGGTAAVLDVAELVLAAAAQELALGAAVLASVCPQRRRSVDGSETGCFLDLVEQFDDAGVVLLDWFVISGDHATSLAELTRLPSRWSGP